MTEIITEQKNKVNSLYLVSSIVIVLIILLLIQIYIYNDRQHKEFCLKRNIQEKINNGTLKVDNHKLLEEIHYIIEKLQINKAMYHRVPMDTLDKCLKNLINFIRANPKNVDKLFDSLALETKLKNNKQIENEKELKLNYIIDCLIIIRSMLLNDLCDNDKINVNNLYDCIYEAKMIYKKQPKDNKKVLLKDQVKLDAFEQENIKRESMKDYAPERKYLEQSETYWVNDSTYAPLIRSDAQLYLDNNEYTENYQQALQGYPEKMLGCVDDDCFDERNFYNWFNRVMRSVGN